MIVDFAFDEKVASVFPDMIRRSVPGYENIITLIGLIAEQYVKADSNIYDLGCSLGAATLSMRHRVKQPGCRIIGVDNAEAMIQQCRNNVEHDDDRLPVELVCADIRDIKIENASMAVMNFTLQFIEKESRLELLTNIANGLNSGGVLVLSEKIIFEDPEEQQVQEQLHLAFKKANGYSDLEISQKRSALENVLIPETIAQHQQRLAEAGFSQSMVWFQSFNFVSILAIK